MAEMFTFWITSVWCGLKGQKHLTYRRNKERWKKKEICLMLKIYNIFIYIFFHPNWYTKSYIMANVCLGITKASNKMTSMFTGITFFCSFSFAFFPSVSEVNSL